MLEVLNTQQNICVLNAEKEFLTHLVALHNQFPRLKIVLEHATTRAAVECVKLLGPTVACTITAHHLAITVDHWAGQNYHYCKPVAKFPDDREALRDIIREGSLALQLLDHCFHGCTFSRPSSLLSRIGFRSSSNGCKGC